MKDILAKLWIKYRRITIYLLCSVISALVESGIGWVILHSFPIHIVIANTLAIICGAVLHYFLTTIFVFKIRKSGASVLVYVITFGLGLLLQDAIIWLLYDRLLANLSDFYRFAFSKAISLAIPFIAIYLVRSRLNERFGRKETESDE